MSTLEPMLATIGTDVPSGPAWVFEPKYDGIRVLAFVSAKPAGRGSAVVSLVSRNGIDKARQFPEITDALRILHSAAKRPFVLDGEVVAMRGDVPLRFQDLQGRMHLTDDAAIGRHSNGAPTALIVFDILLDGKRSLIAEPWRTRRNYLVALMKRAARVSVLRISDVGDDGEAMLAEARRRGWEGIIAKRAEAPYAIGRRSHDWIKLKIERRQEFVVGGWTEPRNSREYIGAILLGYYDAEGALIYCGHTGTGFTRQSLLEMFTVLKRGERKSSPFNTTPKTNQAPHWTRPAVVVEVKFSEWTADGRLRQPVFLGVRDDKPPREVVHEPESLATPGATPPRRRRSASSGKAHSQPAARNKVRAKHASVGAKQLGLVVAQLEEIERGGGAGTVAWPGGSLDVSSLDKIFFPATKQTKGDVMRYYVRIAPLLLPAIADRPLVLKRFPNGTAGKAFYQQRAPADAPASVRVESVSDEGMTTQDKIVGGDLATLLYLVQLGAISIDPWHSRAGSIQDADYAIIDLDPGPRADFQRVVDVALAVKSVLDKLKLHGVPKTSGASGMHIVLPLGDGVPNDGARMIAELIATMVATLRPRVATTERSVRARKPGAVYVDFLQNIRGKTVAGVYSVRAERRPTVSTPLRWDEVNEDLDPAAFTIDTVLPRVRRVGDLWAKGMKVANSLDGIIGNG